MRAAVFLYPWDVVGDPEAPERLAELGVTRVSLAAAYHSVRALTPRHPAHRVVSAPHSAVYYPLDPDRWADQELRPHEQRWMASADPYGVAARALTEAGLEVRSWVVLAHNSRLGQDHPAIAVRNAYGDTYPWAPCVARPEVREYAARLAAEAAVRPGATGTELESCGWYGLEHTPAHDKTGGVPLDGVARLLMSLCFCAVCRAGYAEHGLDSQALRRRVVAVLRPYWEGAAAAPVPDDRESEAAAVRELLGTDHAEPALAWRERAAARFQRGVVAAVREAADEAGAGDFRVLLHADPAPHRCGANPGVRPADVLSHADGVVVPCTGDDAVRRAALEPFAPYLGPAHDLVANLQLVAGMGGRPHQLAADAAHAARLGATELRLYHAGLASSTDLAAVARAWS